jgi:D-inositol-3-phosphate glycosyltransferase
MNPRIAMISEHASPLAELGGVDAGGQNVYVGQLSVHLARLGHEVDVFTRRDDPDLPEVVDWQPGVRVIHVPAGPAQPVRKEELLPLMPAFTDWMVERLRGERVPYDLAHANFFMSGLVAAELRRILDLPFVITFHALGRVRREHQGANDGFPDDRQAIEDRIVREADRVIAECPQDADDLIRLYDADPDRLTLVPCGFDSGEFWPVDRAVAREALGLDPSEPVVLQLGRIVPRKGIDTVIEAIGLLRREHGLDVRLLVVGGEHREPDLGDPEFARLASLADRESIADLVTFVGRRDRAELRTYYAAADVFATTPWYEPFGMTPLESMACGTPVVGSNVGGIKFTVRDAETGYLVPPRDPAALAERIAHLFRVPKLLSTLGRQGVRRVNDLFTWARVAGAMATVYEDVLSARRPLVEPVRTGLALVDASVDELILTLREARRRTSRQILAAADLVVGAFAAERMLLIAGNGGSAADAQHLAAEFVGRFRVEGRPGLPALALPADSAITTAWANDVGYDDVFARQVGAFGRPGDVLLGISTSGRSANLVAAFREARRRGLRTIGLLGGDGGRLRRLSDVAIVVPARDTQRIQETHGIMIHLLSELVESRLQDAGWFRDTAEARSPWRETAPSPLPAPPTTAEVTR